MCDYYHISEKLPPPHSGHLVAWSEDFQECELLYMSGLGGRWLSVSHEEPLELPEFPWWSYAEKPQPEEVNASLSLNGRITCDCGNELHLIFDVNDFVYCECGQRWILSTRVGRG